VIRYFAVVAVGTWRSLVARTLGVREVAGSNPVVPTTLLSGPVGREYPQAPLDRVFSQTGCTHATYSCNQR
jgi:hypothetical protein